MTCNHTRTMKTEYGWITWREAQIDCPHCLRLEIEKLQSDLRDIKREFGHKFMTGTTMHRPQQDDSESVIPRIIRGHQQSKGDSE